MGRFNEAFQVLENVFTHKSSILLISFSDPLAESIQQAPQYQSYRQRLYPTASIKKKRAKKPASRIMDEETVRAQLNKLLSFIDDERPFLNPELSLRLLAKSLSIHPNQLSWLINEYHGKNFNEFINQKRIAHFKTLVVNPKNSHISLIGLAYESGFNSKTVFNTVFKKEVGMTPSQYQRSKK
ncbi:MAG: AraC family transcriptional regulator [Saprospiraceae bacterium]|nr:AraC family transcriptional regulator [Saprospiraceae bacterium]